MRRISFWIITALLTFTIGVVASTLWIFNEPSSIPVQTTVTPSTTSQIAAPSSSQNIDPRWVYINKDIKWESPPQEISREFNYNFKYSVNAHLMVFYPDGQFASVGCVIYRDNKSRKMQFIPNEGFIINKGTWKRNDNGTITIAFRLASSNKVAAPIGGDRYKERAEQLTIKAEAHDRLAKEIVRDRRIFIPGPNVEGLEKLLSMANDTR